MDGLVRALPLYEWMRVTVAPLAPHPNDPAVQQRVPRHRHEAGVSSQVPEPRLTEVSAWRRLSLHCWNSGRQPKATDVSCP
jgi:hypothetical protein